VTEYHKEYPPLPETLKVEPLPIDAGTPDAWVPRDERMVRLTGKHPYNCEAPLADLWNAGWLTPQPLFYVRTHGATPHVTAQEAKEWKVKVNGLVKRPMEFTIDDLKRLFPTVSVPITLVCAGNRRKEQNMVAKGLGFNWGSAGVSNGILTGVYLADVLDYCKPIRPIGAFPYDRDVPGRARHVSFEGVDELPKGKYGTSQRLLWARDRSKSMLLAWGLNGEELSPDHGYPLRLVVPGQIGGRMVKWLETITVSDKESQAYLHFKDNKVLPASVSADEARSEEGEHWWTDPKYIINELNTNASITVPNHDTTIPLPAEGEEDTATTKICGYAYTGGGRRVHRVELSLDDGATWEYPAKLIYPEDKYREMPMKKHPFYGTLDLSETEMSFSWCFWEHEIKVARLRDSPASSLALRATDESLHAMPDRLIWNAYGMMNNCHFRVGIHNEDGKLRFEHPTLAGNATGGWMGRVTEEGGDPRHPIFNEAGAEAAAANAGGKPKKEKVDVQAMMMKDDKKDIIITAEMLKEHANEDTPWFIVNGHVYDGTPFLKLHPGGGESITLVAGEDASEDFMAIHSMDAKRQLSEFHVGKLAEGALEGAADVVEGAEPSKVYLNPKQWKKSKLISRTEISHDSRILRFGLDHPDQELGMPTGQHVYMRVKPEGSEEVIQRAYTPFSDNSLIGAIDILIKVYMPTKDFPTGGKMTSVLEKMQVGDELELKGPLGGFTFMGKSMVRWKGKERKVRKMALICGGSGITPIWSTIKGLIDCAESKETECWMLNGNRTEADILAKEHIDALRERFLEQGRRFDIWHVLSGKTADDWNGGKGRINVDLMKKHLPPPPKKRENDDEELEDTLALVCGPPAMEHAVKEGLAECGWDVPNTVVFF
jgi:nitrate reductase (NAD(P)H)